MKINKNKEILVIENIQSYTDIITNSSSELFCIVDPKHIIEDIINELESRVTEDCPESYEERTSGNGGCLELSTVFDSFKKIESDYEIPYEEEYYTYKELVDWFGFEETYIFELYLKGLIKQCGGENITKDSILIEIDWCRRFTISNLITIFGAIKINL